MRKKSLQYFGAFSILFLIDLLSKFATDAYLPRMEYSSSLYPYGGIPIFENFLGIECSITHRINTGAAWGMLADYQIYLLISRIFLVIGMIIYLFKFNDEAHWEIPFGLIITGAIGNILDFFIYGHVVDMFHFVLWTYDYPVFNVADALIFCGVFSLFVLSFKEKKVEV